MRSNDFNKIAFLYDRIARLVYSKRIIDSQKYFLNKIPMDSNILILGGGTGWILTEIFKIKNEVNICYIEASERMIAMAKEKFENDNRVQFIHGTENDIPSRKYFDVVVTNFYLDLFPDDSLKIALETIKKSTTEKTQWIITDFVNNEWWQSMMLKLMYFFFRVTCIIAAQKLPDCRKGLQNVGGNEIDSKNYYGNFIQTSLFQF